MTFRRTLPVALCLTALMACIDTISDAPDAAPGPTREEEILSHYEEDAYAFQADEGMPDGWAAWMIARKARYAKPYVRARIDRRIRVLVTYDRKPAYAPPWASEQEHFAALERLAELAYPGWDFSFSDDDYDAEFVATLGETGDTSYADGNSVHLVCEGIFLHEFGHVLGLNHHYCDCCGLDLCEDLYPPGEGDCIMSRDAVTWGPTEQFILGLGQERHDEEIEDTLKDIYAHYPGGCP